MFLSYLTLAVALSLSVIAAYYSIAGLTAIFAAAVIPIIVMGSILEIGKVVVTLWLHEYWDRCRWLMKAYLVPAVAVLMLITSMGIFGFLSKAHSDQSMISGDVQAKIAVYDEKIKVSQDNIDANRKALKQLDEAVDQVMGRSTSETGADKAVAIRKSQARERTRLLAEIATEQKTITGLREERAPIAAEVRKVEAEVGPIKYIAALIYGDSADANLLEAAVRWVIILLVIVFDPLAIMMLLAATESLKWERQRKQEAAYAPDEGPLSDDQIQQVKDSVDNDFEQALNKKREVARALDTGGDLPVEDTIVQEFKQDPHPTGWMFGAIPQTQPEPEKSIFEQHPYLTAGFSHFENLQPMVAPKEQVAETPEPIPDVERPGDYLTPLNEDSPDMQAAMGRWKQENPGDTLKHQRSLLERGIIDELPWVKYLEQEPSFGFGNEFPENPNKGDTWVKTDQIPNALYKFNGNGWIALDKIKSDNYTYDTAYIDYLISKISTGEYDPELLSESEQAQVAEQLKAKSNT
jgi:hypothetical protein